MIKKNILKIIFYFTVFMATISLPGCLQFSFSESKIDNDNLKTKIKIEKLEENSFKDLEILQEDISEKIDSADEIEFTEEIRNPFKPFYMKSPTEQNIQNQLTLEKIYSDDEDLYAEIDVNSSTYKLKKDDQFAKIYKVQAINEDSIVLLKGDELITIYMNEIYYD